MSALAKDTDRILAFSNHWIIRESVEDGNLKIQDMNVHPQQYGPSTLKGGDVIDLAELVLRWDGVLLAMVGCIPA